MLWVLTGILAALVVVFLIVAVTNRIMRRIHMDSETESRDHHDHNEDDDPEEWLEHEHSHSHNHHHHTHHERPAPVFMWMDFVQVIKHQTDTELDMEVRVSMAGITVNVGDPAANGVVVAADANGNAATLDNPPVWSTTDPAVANPSAAADGMSASIAVGAAGTATITATATQNDGTVLTASGDVSVVTPPPVVGPAASLTMTLTPGA